MKLEVNNYKSAASKRLTAVHYNELNIKAESAFSDICPSTDGTLDDETLSYEYPIYKENQTLLENKELQTWQVRKFIEGTEFRMAQNRCLRSTLILLHVCIGVAAAFYSVYAAVGEGYTLQCLPPLVDHFGDAVPFRHGLTGVCHCIFYSMVVVSVSSFLMALGINCWWQHSCVAFMNLLFTTVTAATCVFGGTVMSVHYMVWCDALSEATTKLGCADAAKFYDDKHHVGNMTMYHTKLEMQQINLWAVFPISLMAIVVYASAVYLAGVNDTKGQSIRGFVVLQEETDPLIIPETENTSRQYRSCGSSDDCPPPEYSEVRNVQCRGPIATPVATAPIERSVSPSLDTDN